MTRSPRRSTSEPDSGSAADTAADPESAAKRVAQAQNVCLRLLTARARTRAELTDRLTGRGYSDHVIATVLGRLERAGLLDDAEFAREWVRSRQQFAGKGKRALAVELRNKGVDAEIIAEALAGIDADTERRRAEELVAARLRRERLVDGDEMKVTRRLAGMLARRGYSSAMAFDVVSVALAGERERRRV